MKAFPYLFVAVGLFFTVGTYAASSSQSPVSSQSSNNTSEDSLMLKKLNAKALRLEKELNQLRAEIHHEKVKNQAKTPSASNKGHSLFAQSDTLSRDFGPARYIHGVTVTTSPFLGLRSAYDASDLISQYPSMNEDLLLLQIKQSLEHQLFTVGDSLANRPIVAISGALEGQMFYSSAANGFMGGSSADVDLSTAEIDLAAMVSRWANGYVSLGYDSSAPETGTRVINSRIYLQRGFLTIGNLDVVPIYFTIGQMYVPYGTYSSAMLTTPLTKSMGRIEDRAGVLGFYMHGIYVSAYGFRGNRQSASGATFFQGGGNAGVKNQTSWGSYDVGGGYVTNIADSQGMQRNGLTDPTVAPALPTVFTGFGGSNSRGLSAQFLSRNVPAVNGHVRVSHGHITLLGEFVGVVRAFANTDMTFGGVAANAAGNAASPKAVHAEVDITWLFCSKPMTLAFAFGQTWQALALNLPKNSYTVAFLVSIWKDTIEGIEYRHDVNYSNGTVASGAGIPAISTGGSRNMITGQVGVYF